MMKSERTGMATERVMTRHSWLQPDEELGLMLPRFAVMGGSPAAPTIFLGFGLGWWKVREGYESKVRLHCKGLRNWQIRRAFGWLNRQLVRILMF